MLASLPPPSSVPISVVDYHLVLKNHDDGRAPRRGRRRRGHDRSRSRSRSRSKSRSRDRGSNRRRKRSRDRSRSRGRRGRSRDRSRSRSRSRSRDRGRREWQRTEEQAAASSSSSSSPSWSIVVYHGGEARKDFSGPIEADRWVGGFGWAAAAVAWAGLARRTGWDGAIGARWYVNPSTTPRTCAQVHVLRPGHLDAHGPHRQRGGRAFGARLAHLPGECGTDGRRGSLSVGMVGAGL